MMLTGFIVLLFLTDEALSERNCSHHEVINHLKLANKSEIYLMTRPVKNYKDPTMVSLEVLLYAILDVIEKEQKFIPYVWTTMTWQNDFLSWDPQQFCGIEKFSLPNELFWKPDLTIEEMTENDRTRQSPYLMVNYKGLVEVHNDQMLVSTCRMHIYKFPFDVQKCNLTFKSIIYTVKDLQLLASDNTTEATESSSEVMRTQYEWLFEKMAVTKINATESSDQDRIIYTITMKRRSILYIVNFLLPIMFFLCLDMASFLISDGGGEKLSFQVTVLLAVTVLQLILNEILPASSNRVPLIAQYCIGIFGLMLLSLLETIFVMYLREKDALIQAKELAKEESLSDGWKKNREHSFSSHHGGEDMHKLNQGAWSQDASSCETSSELLSVAKEGNSSKLMEDSHALEKLTDELRQMEKILSLLLRNMTKGKKGYWTRMAKKFNTMFFISYVTVVAVFLCFIFIQWF